MPLEVGNYIADFVTTNPDGTVDPVYLLDDGQRLIKQFVKQSFPNIASEVSATAGDLNRSIFMRQIDREISASAGDLNRLGLLRAIGNEVSATAGDLNRSIFMRQIDREISASSGDLNRMALFRDFTNSEISDLPFPVGTAMLFRQTSAPTGWTGDATGSLNHMLRVVPAGTSGGVSGGTMNPINGLTITNSHTLTVAEMPAHTHEVSACRDATESKEGTNSGLIANPIVEQSGSTGGGGGHTHGISWTPFYYDIIFATKA